MWSKRQLFSFIHYSIFMSSFIIWPVSLNLVPAVLAPAAFLMALQCELVDFNTDKTFF